MRTVNLVRGIQRLLERIYQVEIDHSVVDFLITDPKFVRLLEGSSAARDVNEKLLVAEAEDGIDIALYLDQSVLDRLYADDPFRQLHDGNLSDFWVALEGVSHFVYLVRSAAYDRKVTLLELELQAEVDKYVSTLFLLHQQQGSAPARLHHWLFEKPVFDEALESEALERYRRANRYAGKYCLALESYFLKGSGQGGILPELRRFYRMPHHKKMRHIDYRRLS